MIRLDGSNLSKSVLARIAAGEPFELSPHPVHPSALRNDQALALEAAGELAQAEGVWRGLLAEHPRQSEVWGNLGSLLARLSRWEEAEAALQRAITLNPALPQNGFNLGNLRRSMGRLEGAEAAYRETLQRAPRFVDAHTNLGTVLARMGRTREALACCEAALRCDPRDLALHSNRLVTLSYLPGLSAEALDRQHRAFGAWLAEGLKSEGLYAPRRQGGDRLRIAYLSPDLRDHAVTFFLEPVLRHHDRHRVDVWAYSLVSQPDAVTARLKGLVEHWVEAWPLDDKALAQRIRADGIDALVDLVGHFSGNRIGVVARRPAPLCLSWLGYPGATGLPGVVRLTDRWLDPEAEDGRPGRDAIHPLTFAHGLQPPDPRPAVTEAPFQRKGRVTAGCLQNWSKLNPETITDWAGLLRQNPALDLLFLDAPPEGGAWVLAAFQQAGIHADRVGLRVKARHGDFYGSLAEVDFLLDTTPYSGTTTTALALWAGVPTLTLLGDRPCGRTSASVLAAAGLEDWIAESPATFAEKARFWVQHADRLGELRAALPQRLEASALCDGRRLALDLEEAFRQLLTSSAAP